LAVVLLALALVALTLAAVLVDLVVFLIVMVPDSNCSVLLLVRPRTSPPKKRAS
jgi:hypothetical protein